MNKQERTTEEWKPIPGYDGLYEASDLGRIRSVDRYVVGTDGVSKAPRGVILSPCQRSGNYLYVKLWKDGTRKTQAVHRLVASSFVPNPNHKPEVNHIDGCKTNNRAENLEWCTHTENVKHAFLTGLCKTSEDRITEMVRRAAAMHEKSVVRSDGAEFDSVRKAAEASGVHPRAIDAIERVTAQEVTEVQSCIVRGTRYCKFEREGGVSSHEQEAEETRRMQ